MEFFEAVESRRSVRKFTAKEVPPEVIEKALQAALLAPNSSNLQLWEFYWVRSIDKKSELVKACFAQGAAVTAKELIVAVSRIDTWKRNRDELMTAMALQGKIPSKVKDYYLKLIPFVYFMEPTRILGVVKKLVFTVLGFFRPSPRGPVFRSGLFEVVSKSAALACENFMLAIAAQGYSSCPMEGYDEVRVKKLIGLNRHCHVVMTIGIGEADPAGIFGERIRLDSQLFIKRI